MTKSVNSLVSKFQNMLVHNGRPVNQGTGEEIVASLKEASNKIKIVSDVIGQVVIHWGRDSKE